MRKIFCGLLICFFVESGLLYSQMNNLYCNSDSIDYKSIYESFGDKKINYFESRAFLKKRIFQNKWEDEICGMLFFTKIFDLLLLKGLDLNYNIVINPPIKNSSEKPLTQEELHNNIQYNLYITFLKVKELYELFVLRQYSLNEEIFVERDVNNIIRYGTFIKPVTLKNILLNKYKYLTRERMDKQWENALNKN